MPELYSVSASAVCEGLASLGLGSKPALLIIDMQNDFADPGGKMYVPGSAEVVPYIGSLLRVWRTGGLPVIHVTRLYLADYSNAEPCRRALLAGIGGAAAPQSDGARIPSALLPEGAPDLRSDGLMSGEVTTIGPNEWCIYKPRWGAFYETALLQHLQSLGVDGIVICGCNLPNCPRATAFEASERDFSTAVVSDATSQATSERLRDLDLIGVRVLSSEEVLLASRLPGHCG